MSNLFDYREYYPDAPGFTNHTTSREAAEAMKPSAGTLRAMALSWIERSGLAGMTANELSAAMNVDRAAVQPRTTELKLQGKIVDSGMRRHNANGKRAIVWVTVAYYAPATRPLTKAERLQERISYLEMLLTKEGIEYDHGA